MFFTPWYNAMVVIILATSFYQSFWMKKNGFKTKGKTPHRKALSWIFLFLPIANTFLGILSLIMLIVYAFDEDLIRESFENSSSFEKIKK